MALIKETKKDVAPKPESVKRTYEIYEAHRDGTPWTKEELLAEAKRIWARGSHTERDQLEDFMYSVEHGYRRGEEAENIRTVYNEIDRLRQGMVAAHAKEVEIMKKIKKERAEKAAAAKALKEMKKSTK
jgi:uncharacterized coiled-coil DUF342 family protein